MRRDVLLLQGPVGPFFQRFSQCLESRGFRAWKVNFNGGDRFFFRGERALDYTGRLDQWAQYLERLVVNRAIGRIYLFGDCRSYHRIAREVAGRLGVRVFVFEEGYVRPNFITLEEGGVNGLSSMMHEPIALDAPAGTPPIEYGQPGRVFETTAIYSMLYYWAAAAGRRRYPHYRHHRPIGWFSEGSTWLRSGVRKLRYALRERNVLKTLLPAYENNYFVCPLQVHCDMQVVVHSDFNSIEHFIGEVLASFAEHAPANKAIVFKHHPLDRGYTDYTRLLGNLSAELGIEDRVFYVHDLDLPTLLRNAQGSVLINSTVGISSLFHGTPVKTLGRAIYDLPGLTEQGGIDDFWTTASRVDPDAFDVFRLNLVLRNQINGNLYRRIDKRSAAGLVWSREMLREHTWVEERAVPREAPRLSVVRPGTGRRGGARARRRPESIATRPFGFGRRALALRRAGAERAALRTIRHASAIAEARIGFPPQENSPA